MSESKKSISDQTVKINEIWLCKSSYKDSSGEIIQAEKDYYVLIKRKPQELDGEYFVRVQPISKEIEHRTDEDILVENESILGAPFIIETWNGLPLLTMVLDKKVGEIPFMLPVPKEQEEYTEEQLQFRKKELDRTDYLKQSILSFLAENEQSARVIRLNYKHVIAIAASILILIYVVWQPQKPSKNEFYKTYAKHYPNKVFLKFNDYITGYHTYTSSDSNRVDSSFNNGKIDGGNECRLPNFTVKECKLIQQAMEKYDKKDYSNASKLFLNIPDLETKNPEFYFYFGLSQLFADNAPESILIFKKLSGNQELTFYNDVIYYLSLAYVKNNEYSNAKKTIKKLKGNNFYYQDIQENFLKDLRWF